MPNVDELLDGVSQIVTAQTSGTLFFNVLDLKLTPETARQCKFNIVGGRQRAHINF